MVEEKRPALLGRSAEDRRQIQTVQRQQLQTMDPSEQRFENFVLRYLRHLIRFEAVSTSLCCELFQNSGEFNVSRSKKKN